jgi:hypothetical protein
MRDSTKFDAVKSELAKLRVKPSISPLRNSGRVAKFRVGRCSGGTYPPLLPGTETERHH